jgi:hypothetical protein
MGCIEAITPSCPNLGMSAALMCCACSMRHRRSVLSGCALNAASLAFLFSPVGSSGAVQSSAVLPGALGHSCGVPAAAGRDLLAHGHK